MYRLLGVGSMVLILLTFFTTAAWAGTMQAKVTADEVSYDYELKQVEAKGNVKIEYKNVKVTSDYALIDQDQDILLATGKVVVQNKNETFQGDKFLYYLKTQQGWVSPLDSQIVDSDINGPVKLTAAEAFVKGEELRTKKSTFTSCDLKNPHYHFSAKAIEYYPGDVVIMHRVWYYEGKIPLFYFPILYISLKKDNFEVDYGESASEGWFVDTKYYYYFPESYSYGSLFSHLTQFGGNYLELDHSIDTSHTGVLTQKYGFMDKGNMTNTDYVQANNFINSANNYTFDSYTYYNDAEYGSPKDDYMLGLDYKDYLNPKVLTDQEISSFRHFTSSGTSYLDNRYHLLVTSQSPYPSLELKYSDLGEDTYRNIDLRPNWQYNPDKTTALSLNGEWVYQGLLSDTTNEQISKNYTFTGTKNWGWSNLHVTLNDYENYSNTQSSSNNLLPEVIYTIPDYKAPLVGDISIVTAYTHMETFSTPDVTSSGDRYAWNVDKTINLYHQGKISINNQNDMWYRDFFITQNGLPNTETELFAASSQINVTDQFTRKLSSTVGLGDCEPSGEGNTFFGTGGIYTGDNASSGAFIQNSWDWQSRTLKADLTTGYHFYTQLADPVQGTVDWNPAPNETLHFDTIYDWILGLGQTDLNVNYNPKPNWNVQLGMSYNFQNPSQPWGRRSFLVQIDDKLSTNWEYIINAQYDDLYGQFSVAQTGLVYDWHCRKVLFNADWLNRIYSVEIYIKAFPSAGLQLATGETMGDLVNGLSQ